MCRRGRILAIFKSSLSIPYCKSKLLILELFQFAVILNIQESFFCLFNFFLKNQVVLICIHKSFSSKRIIRTSIRISDHKYGIGIQILRFCNNSKKVVTYAIKKVSSHQNHVEQILQFLTTHQFFSSFQHILLGMLYETFIGLKFSLQEHTLHS